MDIYEVFNPGDVTDEELEAEWIRVWNSDLNFLDWNYDLEELNV